PRRFRGDGGVTRAGAERRTYLGGGRRTAPARRLPHRVGFRVDRRRRGRPGPGDRTRAARRGAKPAMTTAVESFSLARYLDAVERVDSIPPQGRVSRVMGLLVESAGPRARV